MATIPSYLSWVPKTGTGNAQIKINSVNPYTGRADRSTKVSGKIVGKSNAVTVTVLEKAADEFITPNGLTINVAKGGETIHVTGKSNSKLLTFTWKTNFGIANVTSFKVNGSTTATSGTAITGDPGATGGYTYDVTVVVPKNETIKARSATLEIKGEGASVVKTITITQALGDSYLYLNSQGTTTATVTIPKGGGEQILKVLSNDEWTFEEVSVTIKVYEIYDSNKLYLAADIKEISITGTTVGTTRPDEPLVITKNKDNVITYYALPISSDWYNIGHEEVVFDTDKTVEILCLRNNNGLIKVRTRDALTGCMISDTIYDETGKKIGNCDSSEDGYVSEANPIGFERNYKTLGDNRYEATEPALFIAAKPSEAVVNYIDLHPKEGQDYIALKFVDSVTKVPITSGISCRFTSIVKTIVTDYQGIAHISGTYDSKVVILVRRNGYVEYNQSYDNLANHSVTTIELVPEPVFENDGIDYMQIEGDDTKHSIFRVGNVESN